MDAVKISGLVLGTDNAVLAKMPLGERRYLARVAILVMATGCLLFMMSYGAIACALDHGGAYDRVLATMLAVLASLMVVLIEINIIDSLLFAHGEYELSKPSREPAEPLAMPIKRIMPLVALAMVPWTTVGIFGDLTVFKPEIEQQLAHDHRRANAALVSEIERAYREELDRQKQITEALEQEANGLLGESPPLEAKRERLEDVSAKLKTERERLSSMQAKAAATIEARVRADMRYVQRDEGLAARFKALHEVALANPSIIPVMLLVTLSNMSLELGTIMSVELTAKKLLYPVHIAENYYYELRRRRVRYRGIVEAERAQVTKSSSRSAGRQRGKSGSDKSRGHQEPVTSSDVEAALLEKYGGGPARSRKS